MKYREIEVEDPHSYGDETAFCPHCLMHTPYTTYDRMAKHKCEFLGRDVLFNEWYNVCDVCGNEVYVEDIEIRNLYEYHAACRVDEFVEYLRNKFDKAIDIMQTNVAAMEEQTDAYNKLDVMFYKGKLKELINLKETLPIYKETYLSFADDEPMNSEK